MRLYILFFLLLSVNLTWGDKFIDLFVGSPQTFILEKIEVMVIKPYLTCNVITLNPLTDYMYIKICVVISNNLTCHSFNNTEQIEITGGELIYIYNNHHEGYIKIYFNEPTLWYVLYKFTPVFLIVIIIFIIFWVIYDKGYNDGVKSYNKGDYVQLPPSDIEINIPTK